MQIAKPAFEQRESLDRNAFAEVAAQPAVAADARRASRSVLF